MEKLNKLGEIVYSLVNNKIRKGVIVEISQFLYNINNNLSFKPEESYKAALPRTRIKVQWLDGLSTSGSDLNNVSYFYDDVVFMANIKQPLINELFEDKNECEELIKVQE